jgi:hypothetical protein
MRDIYVDGTCKDCFFGQHPGLDQFGWMCRRVAPIAVLSVDGVKTRWPRVGMDEFCGEFVPNKRRAAQ